jgi:hypothetical protein
MHNFGSWKSAASNVVGFATFRQTLQLPSSGRMYDGGSRKPSIKQAVGGVWDVRDLTVETEERV